MWCDGWNPPRHAHTTHTHTHAHTHTCTHYTRTAHTRPLIHTHTTHKSRQSSCDSVAPCMRYVTLTGRAEAPCSVGRGPWGWSFSPSFRASCFAADPGDGDRNDAVMRSAMRDRSSSSMCALSVHAPRSRRCAGCYPRDCPHHMATAMRRCIRAGPVDAGACWPPSTPPSLSI